MNPVRQQKPTLPPAPRQGKCPCDTGGAYRLSACL